MSSKRHRRIWLKSTPCAKCWKGRNGITWFLSRCSKKMVKTTSCIVNLFIPIHILLAGYTRYPLIVRSHYANRSLAFLLVLHNIIFTNMSPAEDIFLLFRMWLFQPIQIITMIVSYKREKYPSEQLIRKVRNDNT